MSLLETVPASQATVAPSRQPPTHALHVWMDPPFRLDPVILVTPVSYALMDQRLKLRAQPHQTPHAAAAQYAKLGPTDRLIALLLPILYALRVQMDSSQMLMAVDLVLHATFVTIPSELWVRHAPPQAIQCVQTSSVQPTPLEPILVLETVCAMQGSMAPLLRSKTAALHAQCALLGRRQRHLLALHQRTLSVVTSIVLPTPLAPT